MPTAKERILKILAADKIAICDDCLSKLAQVTPRQQVNQICEKDLEVKSLPVTLDQFGIRRRAKVIPEAANSGRTSVAEARGSPISRQVTH
jgi:hypothetical protein